MHHPSWESVLTTRERSTSLKSIMVYALRLVSAQLCRKGTHAKLVIKLAEHSGTGLVVVEGGIEKDANSIEAMIETIQV